MVKTRLDKNIIVIEIPEVSEEIKKAYEELTFSGKLINVLLSIARSLFWLGIHDPVSINIVNVQYDDDEDTVWGVRVGKVIVDVDRDKPVIKVIIPEELTDSQYHLQQVVESIEHNLSSL